MVAHASSFTAHSQPEMAISEVSKETYAKFELLMAIAAITGSGELFLLKIKEN